MTEKDESDPAFPVTLQNVSRGMTLRDWLAGQALSGIAFDCGLSAKEAAEKAYELADAMLEVRSKP